MTKEQILDAIRQGKKMRRAGHNGYVFSYDGIMASIVTDEGKTLTAFKPIEDLVIFENDNWEEAEAFNMDITDFAEMVLK